MRTCFAWAGSPTCLASSILSEEGGGLTLALGERIIVDAAIRRFKAQKIYLKAVAALRWLNARQAVLAGQRAHVGHAAALGQVRGQLRAVSCFSSINVVLQ